MIKKKYEKPFIESYTKKDLEVIIKAGANSGGECHCYGGTYYS